MSLWYKARHLSSFSRLTYSSSPSTDHELQSRLKHYKAEGECLTASSKAASSISVLACSACVRSCSLIYLLGSSYTVPLAVTSASSSNDTSPITFRRIPTRGAQRTAQKPAIPLLPQPSHRPSTSPRTRQPAPLVTRAFAGPSNSGWEAPSFSGTGFGMLIPTSAIPLSPLSAALQHPSSRPPIKQQLPPSSTPSSFLSPTLSFASHPLLPPPLR
jgi:hypothetical protein